MDIRRGAPLGRLALACLSILAALAAPAAAATAAQPPESIPERPAGFEVSGREAVRVANQDPRVVGEVAERGTLRTVVEPRPEDDRWQVGYFEGDDEVAVVFVDPHTGAVRESWTGYQVAWQMARGYEGQFGHRLNAPYVWLPLAALFLCGLLDWRRPWRVVHLDLLVLLGFGVSLLVFNRGEIGLSVPLAYPPLIYLFLRMLWMGFRGGGPGLRPTAPIGWLAIAALLLIAFRVTLNILDSGVIDVGYSGVIGADRIAHGEPIYGEFAFPSDNRVGDTYGPTNYYAYVPFEAALPWSGEWDELPAAHAAALFFDLATVAGLFLLGGRLRAQGSRGLWPGREGQAAGVVLAFAWLAYPFTAFALQANSNDSLVAALLVWALVLFAGPLARGALLGVAVLTKFAPLALVPLFAAGDRGLLAPRIDADRRRPRLARGRPVVLVCGAFALAAGLLLAHPAIDPGLAAFWERTVSNQLDRASPFSVWGQEPSLDWVRTAVWVGAGGLSVLIAFVPRRRSLAQISALGAAALIASQLAVEHWFYLYIPWFSALVFAVLVGSNACESGSASSSPPMPPTRRPPSRAPPLPTRPAST